MAEAMKLLQSTKSKTTMDENDENLSCLEIIEVVFVYCNIGNNDYQHDGKVLYKCVPNKSCSQLLDISPKNLYFQKPLIQSFHLLK